MGFVMSVREPALQEFLISLGEALRLSTLSPEATQAIDKIYEALRTPGRPGISTPCRLPACGYLPEALAAARAKSASIARVASAIAALEPSLAWARRATGGPFASSNWPEGHANATIVGPSGLESRNDLHIGVSLLAPHVRYPDHNHAPEEVYLVLSPGRFQHGASEWFEPGVGGTLYNEPNIRHAMASDAKPLIALWCLWAGKAP